MATKKKPDLFFFDEIESTDTDKSYTFFEDYVEENPDDIKVGDILKIHSLVLTKKRKGYMVRTDKFDFHIWKNNKITKQLLEALKVWTQEGTGKALYVQVTAMNVDGLKLAANKAEDVNWYGFGGKYSIYPISMEELESTSGTGNIFLT